MARFTDDNPNRQVGKAAAADLGSSSSAATNHPSKKANNNAGAAAFETGGTKYTSSRKVIFGIGFYALCSSSMLFFNKLSVSDEHVAEFKLLPGPISCIQLAFANAFCLCLWLAGIERFEDLRNAHTLKMYSIYCVLFVGE
jgi:hypothetical protein